MKKWQVWLEGYAVNERQQKAELKGEFEAETFRGACKKWVETLPEDQRKHYDPEPLSYWACRFYDNETDARKHFG